MEKLRVFLGRNGKITGLFGRCQIKGSTMYKVFEITFYINLVEAIDGALELVGKVERKKEEQREKTPPALPRSSILRSYL